MTPNHYKHERDVRRVEMYRTLQDEERDGESAGLTCLADRDPELRAARVAEAERRLAPEIAKMEREEKMLGDGAKARISMAAKASRARRTATGGAGRVSGDADAEKTARTRVRGSGEVCGLLLAGLVAVVALLLLGTLAGAGDKVFCFDKVSVSPLAKVVLDHPVEHLGSVTPRVAGECIQLVRKVPVQRDSDLDTLRTWCFGSIDGASGHARDNGYSLHDDYKILADTCIASMIRDDTPPARMVRDGSRVADYRQKNCRKDCVMSTSLLKMSPAQLWHEAEVLNRFVKRLPRLHPLRKLFAYHLPDADLPDDMDAPDPAAMRKLIQAVMDLPAAQRKKLLNGWMYVPGWMSREECVRRLGKLQDWEVSSMLVMEVRSDEVVFVYDDRPACCFLDTSVEIAVRFGTTREEVIAGLREALAIVEKRWGNLPSMQPSEDGYAYYQREQKSGVPTTPDTDLLGGDHGEGAEKTAAA